VLYGKSFHITKNVRKHHCGLGGRKTTVLGYIYVLSGSFKQRIVQIGRTDEDSADRIAELSGATGVTEPI
jgi:hypothetical protein